MPRFSIHQSVKNVFIPQTINASVFDVDQFTCTEFFRTKGGMERRDYQVAMNSSPEVQEKMRQYLVENEVAGFDPSVSDEEVMKSINSRYNSMSSILDKINSRLSELRQKEQQKAFEEETKDLGN